jgi:hypothetical protein
MLITNKGIRIVYGGILILFIPEIFVGINKNGLSWVLENYHWLILFNLLCFLFATYVGRKLYP